MSDKKAIEVTKRINERCNQIAENLEFEFRMLGFVKPEFLKIMLYTVGEKLLKRAGELE